ncbi:MAG: FAD-dependent oxidoreductase [Actinomycetales bacterium]|nr:FAD-dependent oxidoreductase [Actinomycetales bacterium]
MTRPRRTVIVGGVAAGMSAATRLRRLDEHMEILVLERGAHVSFANCGLPYHVSGVIPDRADLLLQTPESLRARFALDVRTGHEVTRIDRDAREVHVLDRITRETRVEPYDSLVLATGASPVRPQIPGAERAHTLRDVADLDAIMTSLDAPTRPRTAVIVGGGFIGLELAENFHHAGLAVTVVEATDQVLAPLDPELSALVQERLELHGVTVRTGATVVEIGSDDVALAGGALVRADLVVLAVGVRPESGLARAAGLELTAQGAVVVDASQRTSDPAIFAVGDVAAKRDAVSGDEVMVPLAQTANRHGRLVADAITGRSVAATPTLGTAVVGVLGLTAAVTGWNEKRLRAVGRPYRAIHTHPAHHAGYYPGAEPMALKLLVDPISDEILGAQGVGGAGVDKRIDVIATAMRGGLRASELANLELAYAPQFGSAKDPVTMLGMIADNLAAGLTATVQWHEVARELDDGAFMLDVRSAEEFAGGSLPKAVNIPLDELRARHDEVPAGRVVVTCAVGQRGHTSAMLLRQLGHPDVANLDGGYRTWLAAPEVH